MCRCKFSNSETSKPPGFLYGLEFTPDQQKYILEKLNEANSEELARLGKSLHTLLFISCHN